MLLFFNIDKGEKGRGKQNKETKRTRERREKGKREESTNSRKFEAKNNKKKLICNTFLQSVG
jgi:hypothetical protein